MATRRDVILGVDVETSGDDAIRQLASSFRSLAQEGNDAAPEFARLASELDRLAAQAAELKSFKALGADVEALSSKQAQAARVAAELAVQYDEQSSAVARLKDAQAQAAGAVEAARTVLSGARSALALLRAETDDAGRKTDAYAAQQRALKVEIETAKSALLEKRQALAAVAQEAGAAERIERAIATEYARSAEAAVSSTSALRERGQALQESQQALARMGADASTAANAEQQLTGALRDVVSAGRTAQASAEALAASQRLAAQAAQEQAQWARAQAQAAVVSEQAALRESEAFTANYTAAQALVAKRAEQVEADRLAAIQSRGLADAMDKARAAAASEMAAVRESEQFLQRYEAAARQAATATIQFAQGGSKLNEMFGTTGVRSMAAIEAEIRKVELAMSALERSYSRGSISAADLARATSSAQVRLQQLQTELNTTPKVAGVFEQMNSQVMGLINRFGALGAAVATIGTAVRPVVEATVQLDQMRRALTTVTGSSAEAAKQIEFLRNVAQKAGASVGDVGTAYSKFVASAATAGISMKTVQNVFESVTVAAGNLGLGSEQTKRALEALSQMAAKGTVSMEELRQQLGDALPGALSLMAQGLGLSQRQLIDLVAAGGLLAEDALPALAEALKKLGPAGGEPVSGLVAEWNRLKNVISETTTIFTDGVFGRVAGAALKGIAELAKLVAFGVAYIGESFTVVGKQIGTVVAAIVTRDFKNLSEALAKIEQESTAKLAGLAERLDGVGSAAASASAPVSGLSTGVKAAGTAAAAAAPSVKALEVQVGASAETAKAAAPAHAGLGMAVASAGTAATGGAKSYAALSVALDRAVDAAKQKASATDKLVKAAKDEASALSGRIKLSGDEVAAKIAEAEGSARVSEATQAAAKADADYLAALTASRDARAQYLAQQGATKERIAEVTKELNDKITAQTVEAERSRQSAAAAQAEAEARRVAVEVLKDNSARWDELSKELDAARQNLESVTRRYLEGKAPVEALTEAQTKHAAALRLAKGAVDDFVASIDRQNKVASAEASLRKASLDLDLAVAKNKLAEVQLLGNESAARQANANVKRIELEIDRARLDAARAQAAATLDAVSAQRKEYEQLGLLTPEKRAELDLRELGAKAQKIEAEAGIEGLKQKQRELEILQGLRPGIEGEAGARQRNAGAMKGENDALRERLRLQQQQNEQQQNEQQQKPPQNVVNGVNAGGQYGIKSASDWNKSFPGYDPSIKVGKDGWVQDASGGTQSMSLPTVAGIIETLKGYGLTDAQAAGLAREFTDGNGGIPYFNNAGQLRYGGKGSTLSQALARAAQLVKQGVISPGMQWGGTTPGAGFGDGGATTGALGSGLSAGGSTSHTVTINIGGKATTVNTASAGDAQALTDLLRQLENSAGAAGGGGG